MSEPIEIPAVVYESVERLRGEGFDMNDYPKVLQEMERRGDRVTAAWLHNNRKIYLQGQMVGMVSEENPKVE